MPDLKEQLDEQLRYNENQGDENDGFVIVRAIVNQG